VALVHAAAACCCVLLAIVLHVLVKGVIVSLGRRARVVAVSALPLCGHLVLRHILLLILVIGRDPLGYLLLPAYMV